MDCFLNLQKTRGVTSHDLVLFARRVFHEPRTGHLGTLDPLAVGVLPLALGTYRRLSEYFLGEDKRYFAEFTFGATSDSGDLDGDVTVTSAAARLSEDDVRRALGSFTGMIKQKPPVYSALKRQGRRLYDLAREGEEVEVGARSVAVHELKLAGWRAGQNPKGYFSMRVGRGTYVRALASSIGEALGCGAVVSYLLRVSSGQFNLKEAVTPRGLLDAHATGNFRAGIVDPLEALSAYARYEVASGALEKVIHGVELSPADFALPDAVRLRTAEQGTFLAYELGKEGFPRILAVVYPEAHAANLKYEKVLTRESDEVANRRSRRR